MKLSKKLGMILTFSTVLAANAFAAPVKLTAAEMNTLATVATIDKNEVIISTVAENKTTNASVVDFAKMMVTQHGSNLTQIVGMENDPKAFANALTTGTAKTLANGGNEGLAKLGTLDGVNFDRAYANAMVKGHEAALNLIDTKLMKTATSDEMKKFMTDTRAVVVEHLEHAKAMQQKLGA